MAKQRKASGLDREAAMAARPERLAVLSRCQRPDGLHVCVELASPRWRRWLGAGRTFQRTFVLDELGQEIYAACQGKATVQEIVRQFAERRRVSVPEAELAVTTFLQTMISRGLVAMAVDKDARKRDDGGRAGRR